MPVAFSTHAAPAQPRFAVSLAAAVLLHVLLFSLPLKRGPGPVSAQRDLSVTLEWSRPMPAGHPAERTAEAEESQELLPEAEIGESAAVPPIPSVDAQSPPRPTAGISTAYLLDMATQLEWGAQTTPRPHKPGRFIARPGSSNGIYDGTKDRRASGDTPGRHGMETIDRWLAADGSQNVMITLPSGETYCGRAEAWNPMNPLIEPVMMYRPCGPSSPPTFELSRRRGNERLTGR